jgi:hypothetical protein
MQIRFWPYTTNHNVASFRLRCLSIVTALGSRGLNVDLYKEGDKPEILVLSKRYDSASMEKALKLKKDHGTVICLDLCDNHFYYDVPEAEAIDRANMLRHAIGLVDRVFVSSQYLADVVRQESAEVKSVNVIGDIIERVHHYGLVDIIKHPLDYVRLKVLEASISIESVEKSCRIIWFGSHGSHFTEGGMLDLKTVLPVLEALSRKHKICLTIVSNSKRKYADIFAASRLQTFYIPWSEPFFSAALEVHGVSIIPIQKNPFTMAKTSNRVATSLVHDLRVVADMIPSYVEYSDVISSGDWGKNLTDLLTKNDAPAYVIDIERKNDTVVSTWQRLFEELDKSKLV